MAKGKTWWVLAQTDDVFVPLYKGPDRKRAREVAAKHLGESPKAEVIVAKLSAVKTLRDSDLKRHLPNNAF